jgi:hypothetical protein
MKCNMKSENKPMIQYLYQYAKTSASFRREYEVIKTKLN